MATATADTYSAASGQSVLAGRGLSALSGATPLDGIVPTGSFGPGVPSILTGSVVLDDIVASGSISIFNPLDNVLNIISAAPAESWVQLNSNQMSTVYPPTDYRPLFTSSVSEPARIQGAWPSFAWDHVGHRIIMYGGGHANCSSNEVYTWSAATQLWSLAFYPSEQVIVAAAAGRARSVDFNGTPDSSHTYGNNQFLPTLNRFMTLGGAAYNSGDPLGFWDSAAPSATSPLRTAGAYLLDMAQANTGKVAGATGSNPHRNTTIGVDLAGANAWAIQDWFSLPTTNRPRFGGVDHVDHINCGAVVTQENGHDVAYFSVVSGSRHVWRCEFVDSNFANNIFTYVAAPGPDNTAFGQGPLAFDPTARVIVKILGTGGGGGNAANASAAIQFVDLKRTLGSTNAWRAATIAGAALTEFLTVNLYSGSITFNPVKGCFVIWSMGAQVWEIYAPAGNPTPDTGWSLVKPTMATGVGAPRSNFIFGTGTLDDETGLIGKWRWANDLRCGVTTFGNRTGEVWAYKPTGWIDPR